MKKKDPIPQTDSIRELAQFWDTHDFTDYEDEMENVTEIVIDLNGRAKVAIPLSAKEQAALKRIARERKLQPEPLIRQWIHEKIEAASTAKSPAKATKRR